MFKGQNVLGFAQNPERVSLEPASYCTSLINHFAPLKQLNLQGVHPKAAEHIPRPPQRGNACQSVRFSESRRTSRTLEAPSCEARKGSTLQLRRRATQPCLHARRAVAHGQRQDRTGQGRAASPG
jgi:hypothetical protein